MKGRDLKSGGAKLNEIFDLEKYHSNNIRGKGIKIAIFDSGLSEVFSENKDYSDSPFLQVKSIINYSHDMSARDTVGHGTFIAGVVGSKNKECQGIAPDAEIHVLKLFTSNAVSYTSWFLDAFNYVLQNGIDIVNLSNGSSDFLDIPFIEKINELTANGVIIVSAIGNEGPFQGTLNNPGDLINVIGVGSLDY
jgi:membrane-bound transcription factor site-1 protease